MAEEIGLFGEETEFNELPPAPVEAPQPAPAPVEKAAPEAPKPEEPKGEKVDASPASDRPRDESGKFVKRENEDDGTVPRTAMLAERDRRQAAENRVRELEAAKAATPPADIWTDPDAFVKARLAELEPQILSKAEFAAKEQFFRYTENAAISRHSADTVKYEQALDAFVEVAKRDPLLTAKLRESPDPGEFIYQQGRIAMDLKEVGGDLAAYKARIEAEVTAKLEKQASERAARNAGIPTSLNSEPSKGAGVVGQVFAGPTPDEALFPER